MATTVQKCHDPAHPNRCQAATRLGQCNNLAIEGSCYCIMHGGASAISKDKKDAARRYQLQRFKTQVSRQLEGPEFKSLREEIAILRMMLEERLNMCRDAHDLMLASQSVADLVTKIERTIMSCDRLERSNNSMMDRGALLRFAGQIVDVIGQVVTEPTQLDEISSGIMELLRESHE